MSIPKLPPQFRKVLERELGGEDSAEKLEAVRENLREQCRNDLWFFARYVALANYANSGADIETQLHIEMCERWQKRVARRFSMWLIPRSHLKTSLWTMAGSLWELIRNPHQRILLINAKLDNAIDMVADIKSVVEGNEVFRWLFPEYCIDKVSKSKKDVCKWGMMRLDFPCSRYAGRREGNIQVMSVGASLVSKHYDLMVFDDPVNEDNTTTKEYRDKIFKWYKNSLQLRDNIISSRVRIIGTRWHFDDLYARILKSEEKLRKDQKEKGLPICPNYLIYRRKAIEDDEPIWPQCGDKGFTVPKLMELKEQLGSYIYSCNPGNAPILMADWTFKRFDEVRKGDKVVGVEIKERNRLVITTVEEIHCRMADVVKLRLSNGESIRCTKDHYWYTNTSNNKKSSYVRARRGTCLQKVTDAFHKPNESCESLSWHYLAGIVDGEGHCAPGRSVTISQSTSHNPEVCARIEMTMEHLEVPYHRADQSLGLATYTLGGGRETKARLLRYGKPAKTERLLQSMFTSRGIVGAHKVLNIEQDGEDIVYSMQTGTTNYVVWGYVSQNCQYDNNPLPESDAYFKISDLQEIDELEIPENVVNFMAVDLADEETTRGDFTVITVASFDEDGNMYIREIDRRHHTVLNLIEDVHRLVKKWNVSKVGVETTGFQKAILRGYKQKCVERGYHIPWVEMERGRTSKFKRTLGLQPRVERGDFYYEQSIPNCEWMIEEMTTFPFGAYDDILDTLVDLENLFYKAPRQKQDHSPKDTYDAIYGTLFEDRTEAVFSSSLIGAYDE